MPGPPGYWRQLLPWPSAADDAPITITTEPSRNLLTRRDLSDDAVAGLAVGIVVFCVLLAFCLYPVIVGCLKRRKRERRLRQHRLDEEAAIANGQDASDGARPRLSSSDSLKHSNALARGHDFDPAAVPQSEGVPNPDPVLLNFGQYGPETAKATFEYMPKDMVDGQDDKPGILKGTSEDYYRTSIPSSAFGMVDEPILAEISTRTISRASSLSHNVRHMFRRKSDRNQTLSSVNSSNNGADQGATPLQRITTAEEAMAESPTELSPSSSPAPQSAVFRPPPSATPRGLNAEPRSIGLSNTPSPRALLKSPSPPNNPAPGTVNPMDIMAPSTQTEQWHRIEYQLSSSWYESPPSQALQPPAELDHVSPGSTNQASSPEVHVSSANDDTPEQKASESNHTFAGEDNLLHADNISSAGRHPSFPSEHSTPLPGPGFTDVSSQNTPSTQLDTPSPDSRNSSDFRHSASPGMVANHVPSPVKNQDGMYQCDEPGCTQYFDQPHKLKHHQRYHSKDHKCSYPGCGKGFGTKTHLQRHINDRHEKKKKFHCSVDGCDYSKNGGRAFPRKDNWKRHMIKIHHVEQQQLPMPVEVDAEMTGV
ncbi:Zinc finger domain-containing protein, C2H2-type [Akanthomyces lecanii RCEF 1005]|uniref:Zinc finger domain-containing protein, C2H2-type n=1 Tax=Akanthomyces lecanii RCEF 1005 TaxID=1081108 RepID=A0A168FJA2_CORDF|nr:Zinc finger domain-containing protein, C2H2-type [Akanthomyces lecanii RCEF 1005]